MSGSREKQTLDYPRPLLTARAALAPPVTPWLSPQLGARAESSNPSQQHMASPERKAGVLRRSNIGSRLSEVPKNDDGYLFDNVDFDPPRRVTSADVPDSLYTDIQEGWNRDASFHGWFGGSSSQLEWIEAQNQAIQGLRTELAQARRQATKATLSSASSPTPARGAFRLHHRHAGHSTLPSVRLNHLTHLS